MNCQYSIIICTRNRSDVLGQVLMYHAKLAPTFGVSHEYVIVDNGSTDSTHEVVRHFETMVACRVHYILESRAGHSIALNAGCRRTQGEKLIFTDDDTLPFQKWFQSIHDTFRSKAADWVFGPVVPRWEYGSVPSWYGPETAKFLACVDLGKRILVNDELTGAFAGANHACLRSRIFELGLYDERLGIRGDGKGFAGNDDDLFIRGRKAGFTVVYAPEAGVEHIIAKSRYSRKNHRRNSWIVEKNQYPMLRQCDSCRKILGIPRFHFPVFAKHVRDYLSATVCRNKSRAFFHEIQIVRYAAIYSSAIHQTLRRDKAVL